MNRAKRFLNKRGFTLVESAAVLAIVGVVASIGVTNYERMNERSKNSHRVAEINALKSLVDSYQAEFNAFPSTAGGWRSSTPTDVFYDPNYIPGIPSSTLPHEKDENESRCVSLGSQDSEFKPSYYYKSDGADYKIMNHCSSAFYEALSDQQRSYEGLTWAISISTPGAADW
jgi:prepilin-type N-terminal cleavage/methylation domain-containing protein